LIIVPLFQGENVPNMSAEFQQMEEEVGALVHHAEQVLAYARSLRDMLPKERIANMAHAFQTVADETGTDAKELCTALAYGRHRPFQVRKPSINDSCTLLMQHLQEQVAKTTRKLAICQSGIVSAMEREDEYILAKARDIAKRKRKSKGKQRIVKGPQGQKGPLDAFVKPPVVANETVLSISSDSVSSYKDSDNASDKEDLALTEKLPLRSQQLPLQPLPMAPYEDEVVDL
jgi:hypothetical protein